MPRKSKLKDHGEDTNTLLKQMPLAKAVLDQDLSKLTDILRETLPNARAVQDVTLEQSVGKAFTGGRSTPVYYITAQVVITKSASAGTTSTIKRRQFVVKLVQMLGEDTSSALVHKRESYAVERRFYEFVAPGLRPHLAIPKLLVSDTNGSQPLPIACWLMTDVRVQFPLFFDILDPHTQLLRALDWLAQFHARFWNGNDWRRRLWEQGGFWNKSRSQGSTTTAGLISTAWMSTCQWLYKHHPDRLISTTKSLASRFQALRGPLSEFMFKQSKGPWSTMIHGDYKAANLFFAKQEEDHTSVAAVDFQYTGAGVPAEDVAYILFPDALIDYWEHESRLLEYYHQRLLEALILSNKGGPSSLPFASFGALYQLSRVEITIHWLEKGWVASTNGDAQLVTALEKTMNALDAGKVLAGENEYRKALERLVGIE
jgi:hypothetical protein